MIPSDPVPSSQSPEAEPFEERLAMLFEELELAVRWQRPSILIAVYESEFVRDEAQAFLARRLAEIGQRIATLQISEKDFDVPLLLARHPERDRAVFYVSGLRWGGGKGKFEAYRALNLHREHLVEAQVRAVFWLTRTEAGDLPRRAPDFWAFRHRVIEFNDAAPDRAPAAPSELAWGEWKTADQFEDVEARIALREASLAGLPEGSAALAPRLDLLYDLASLYWAKGELQRSRQCLNRGLELAGQVRDPGLLARLWAGLGVVEAGLQDVPKALSACQQALALDPDAAAVWSNLAALQRGQGQSAKAIESCQRAIALDPQAAPPWIGLGNIYRDLGRLEPAGEAYRKATRLAPGRAAAWSALGAVCRDQDRPKEALRAFSKAARLEPRPAHWKDLAGIYQSQGRAREAVKAYKAALALDPADNAATAALAACLAQAAPPRRQKTHRA